MSDDSAMAIVINQGDGVGSCKCSKCGTSIYWKDHYCRNCGRKLIDVEFRNAVKE